MAKIFQIAAPADTVDLDPEGQGRITFTVTNLARSVAARAVVIPSGETDEGWLSIDGEDEEELAANDTVEWTVKAEVPEEVPPGDYPFRIDVVSELNPDEDFSEGPEVVLRKAPVKKRRWLWLILAIVVFLIVLTVLLFWLLGGGDEEEAADPEKPVETVEIEDPESGGEKMIIGLEAPNLMGLSQEKAKEHAEALGLKVGPVEWLDIESLEIAGQEPKPGEFIKEGGTIVLRLESEVPELVGRTVREAESLLEEAGLALGKEEFEISDKGAAGQILRQSHAPAVSLSAGTEVDLTLSVGQCTWTPPFGVGYGLNTCRPGSALAGLACVDSKCNLWQLRCCPYLPSADAKAKRRFTAWIKREKEVDRSRGVIDGLELRGGKKGASEMRARYLESPRLSVSQPCRSSDRRAEFGQAGGFAASCKEGFFVDAFGCVDKRCNQWMVGCCGQIAGNP